MTDVVNDPGANQAAVYEPFPGMDAFTIAATDTVAVDQFTNLLEQAKESATPDLLEDAVARASKWAAVDTGAIEGLYDVDRGFTFSVAAEAAAWDNIHLVKGEAVARAIHDALAGYDFVLDLVTRSRPITETWIKELHEILCASQATYTVLTAAGIQDHELPKGQYKAHANNPFNLHAGNVHAYAPVTDTPPEMHRLVQELTSDDFRAAHPVVQAAYAHYAFVCIHPFADGNGRVARALASVFLYRSPGVPLVVFADQKPAYINALEAADSGRYDDFVSFISTSAIDTVRMVLDDLRRPARLSAGQRIGQLQQSLVGRGRLSHSEVDALSLRLFDEWAAALKRSLSRNPVTDPMSSTTQVHNGPIAESPKLRGYRKMPTPLPRAAILRVTSAAPASADQSRVSGVLIARGESDVADFVIVDSSGKVLVDVLIRDLTPTTSPSLLYRLDMAADDQVLALIDATAGAAEEQLRKSGYKD